MRKYLESVIAGLIVLILVTTANAIPLTATLTADNHYSLYYGDVQGYVNFVGRNELGYYGNPGYFNWSLPETWSFDVSPHDYLYVAAWSDGGGQAWIGQFVLPFVTILTNETDWQVFIATPNSPINHDSNPAPTTAEMLQYITAANSIGWGSIDQSEPHCPGCSWTYMPEIDLNAKWIWGSNMRPGTVMPNEFQIFRFNIKSVVPEPATLFLLGLGLMGLAGVRRTFKN